MASGVFIGSEREDLVRAVFTVHQGLGDTFPSFMHTAVFISMALLASSALQCLGERVCAPWKRETVGSVPPRQGLMASKENSKGI